MLELFLEQLREVPAYLEVLYEKHLIFIIVTLVLYLIALIFWNKFANFVRWIYALAAIGFLVYAFFKKNWALMIIVVASVIVMLIWRLIGSIVRAVKQKKRDRKIERRALEQAAKRRGSWEAKQAYSGTKPKRDAENTAAPSAAAAESSAKETVSQNTLTDMIDTAPKDPMKEIEATKAELSKAAYTGRIDTDEIEAEIRKRAEQKAD